MKKLIGIILVIVLALSLSACNSGKNEALTGNEESVEGQGVSEEEQEKQEPYVGAYYVSGYGPSTAYMITASGETEDLGDVYGYVRYTDNGKYVVWRDNTILYAKQPGKDAVKLADNVDDFTLNKATGLLIAFCDDGIYAGKEISEGIEKVSDMSDGVYKVTTSNDGKYIAYIDTESVLHLMNVNDFSDTVVASNVDHGEQIVCISENELYYETFDDEDYLWNGTDSVATDVSYYNSVDFKQKHISGMEKIGNTGHISPERKYAVVYDDGKYYRYKITDTGFTEETLIDIEYSSPIAMDDGTVVFYNFKDTISVFANGELTEFAGEILGGYYQTDVPYSNGILYYAEGTTLKSYDVKTGTHETLAENIFVYQVHNGYCYYLNDAKEMYRVGIDEKLSNSAEYMLASGFIY